MTSIPKLLELEYFYRKALNKALVAREKAQGDVDFWMEELKAVRRKAYRRSTKGNIFKEEQP
jgi:hypothetical protein